MPSTTLYLGFIVVHQHAVFFNRSHWYHSTAQDTRNYGSSHCRDKVLQNEAFLCNVMYYRNMFICLIYSIASKNVYKRLLPLYTSLMAISNLFCNGFIFKIFSHCMTRDITLCNLSRNHERCELILNNEFFMTDQQNHCKTSCRRGVTLLNFFKMRCHNR